MNLYPLCLQLNTDTLERIPILKKLRALEEQSGKDVTLGANPPAGARDGGRDGGRREPRQREPRRRPRRDTQQDGEIGRAHV